MTETDQVTTMGADGRPTAIAIRGFTDSGDATENFSVDPAGNAHVEDCGRFGLRAVRARALQ